MIKIRDATPQDAERICDMSRLVSAHEGLPPPNLDPARFLAFGFGPDRAFECFVAEVSGELAGHVAITWGFDFQEGCRTVWLADLFVLAQHRRACVGRALIAHVSGIARASGAGYIHFLIAPNNREAWGFYAAIGAKKDGGVPMYLSREGLEALC